MPEPRKPRRRRIVKPRCGCCGATIYVSRQQCLVIIGHFEKENGQAEQYVMPVHLECAKASRQLAFDAGMRCN
jgi:hypothetical protein